MAGRQLRMRMVTIEPGGVFGPLHDHKGRPGTVYVLQGIITDHRDGVATDYGPGVGWPEDRNTLHWLENRGTVPAVEISVDIVSGASTPENDEEPPVRGALSREKIRRRPTLPGGLPPSTIGAGGLNCRVRNGNGCDPAAMATGNLLSMAPAKSRQPLEHFRASTSMSSSKPSAD